MLEIRGEVDAYTAPQLREALREMDGQEARLLVDLNGVDFMDSSGLGVLIGGLKRAREQRASWHWCAPGRACCGSWPSPGSTGSSRSSTPSRPPPERRAASRVMDTAGASFELSVPADPAFLETARLFVGAVARELGVDDDLVDDAKLGVSEACVVAGRPGASLRIRAELDGAGVRFRVDRDSSRRTLHRVAEGPHSTSRPSRTSPTLCCAASSPTSSWTGRGRPDDLVRGAGRRALRPG